MTRLVSRRIQTLPKLLYHRTGCQETKVKFQAEIIAPDGGSDSFYISMEGALILSKLAFLEIVQMFSCHRFFQKNGLQMTVFHSGVQNFTGSDFFFLRSCQVIRQMVFGPWRSLKNQALTDSHGIVGNSKTLVGRPTALKSPHPVERAWCNSGAVKQASK